MERGGGGELLACGNSICICVTSDLGTLLNLQDTLEALACTFGICPLLTALT